MDFDLALGVASYFRLTGDEAAGIIAHIKLIVSKWEQIACKYQISKTEQEMMRPAFRC